MVRRRCEGSISATDRDFERVPSRAGLLAACCLLLAACCSLLAAPPFKRDRFVWIEIVCVPVRWSGVTIVIGGSHLRPVEPSWLCPIVHSGKRSWAERPVALPTVPEIRLCLLQDFKPAAMCAWAVCKPDAHHQRAVGSLLAQAIELFLAQERQASGNGQGWSVVMASRNAIPLHLVSREGLTWS